MEQSLRVWGLVLLVVMDEQPASDQGLLLDGGKESSVLAGLGQGLRTAAAARGDPDAIVVRIALGDDEHQWSVATWSHHVQVEWLPVQLLAAIYQDPHDLWVAHTCCVEELSFPTVVADLSDSEGLCDGESSMGT